MPLFLSDLTQEDDMTEPETPEVEETLEAAEETTDETAAEGTPAEEPTE